MDSKNPGLPDAERAVIAEAVGIAAIKYTDLSSERIKDYVFSFDRMLAFEGNTGPYLLYALVRTKSIFRKAAERGVAARPRRRPDRRRRTGGEDARPRAAPLPQRRPQRRGRARTHAALRLPLQPRRGVQLVLRRLPRALHRGRHRPPLTPAALRTHRPRARGRAGRAGAADGRTDVAPRKRTTGRPQRERPACEKLTCWDRRTPSIRTAAASGCGSSAGRPRIPAQARCPR
ncbi:MAG: arginine--tRNA ligase [Planctomycetota bacterium]|nr:MAG: arginine--tRNA ligase [Planctomycetota bacterium]